MARTGRPKLTNPKRSVTLYLDPKLVEALDLIDYDPFLNRRSYGSRNEHFEKAIREYLQKYHPEILQNVLASGHLS